MNYTANSPKNLTEVSNIQRLKIELSNKKYFDDTTYDLLLIENNLVPSEVYSKKTNEKNLLLTVIAVFQTLANDTDLMRQVTTEFATTTQAYQFIEDRITQLKDRIASIPDEDEEVSMFSLMYTRKPKTDFTDWTNPVPHTISDEDIKTAYNN